ncbi:GAF domain-containing protein [Foetidibacter luteolus]|uniref:GAF domain-containing protein n=1 Tax=Foetidibacter luteolus TaxID=2608880 RepID=UPI00129AE790|nr:GAF domain-containing protein [Foetidibacter luteolus]
METKLSFLPYINYLRHKIVDERDIRATLYRFILRRFERHPELLRGEVYLNNFAQYNDVIPLIEDTVFPLIHEDDESMFALSEPLSPTIFYCTEAFYKLCFDPVTNEFKPTKNITSDKAAVFRLSWIYTLIAEKLYHVKTNFSGEMVHVMHDPETNLNRYFKLTVDPRFIEVKVKGRLPDLDIPALISELSFTDKDLDILQEKLPLANFSFEGFAIAGLTDITAHYTTEIIKNAIINASPYNDEYFDNIQTAIRTLMQHKDIDIGLLPFLKVNDRYVLDSESSRTSIFVQSCTKANCSESSYSDMAQNYAKKTRPFYVPDISSSVLEKYPFLGALFQNGYNGFMIIPLFWNNQLMGVLEMATLHKNVLNEKMISKIDNILPLLAQILKQRVDAFEASLQTVIKEKFTSLQPAVEWKFNEVAWEYLKNTAPGKKDEVKNIYFKEVYPLYGAIDIRNSSVERNISLQKDMHQHFMLLMNTLDDLKKNIKLGLLDETIYKCKKWMERTRDFLTTDDEVRLADFLENDIKPFLSYFRDNFPEAVETVDHYFAESDPQTGIVFENRRQLEASIQLINTSVSNFLETQRDELQKTYPTYFEKFRSDGIEYDIYVGQSIAPQKVFNPLYLKNLRLWQVASMSEIARLAHTLLPKMEKELHTTQLILVHTNTIDISFRNDERRFDVEGAYNIRYEVIKKRIDKVHIKNTNERLTQPGKIALVYFNQKDADEYLKYIQYLQNGGYLLDDVEHLDLEDLQGVAGLKAIRVGISLD